MTRKMIKSSEPIWLLGDYAPKMVTGNTDRYSKRIRDIIGKAALFKDAGKPGYTCADQVVVYADCALETIPTSIKVMHFYRPDVLKRTAMCVLFKAELKTSENLEQFWELYYHFED